MDRQKRNRYLLLDLANLINQLIQREENIDKMTKQQIDHEIYEDKNFKKKSAINLLLPNQNSGFLIDLNKWKNKQNEKETEMKTKSKNESPMRMRKYFFISRG